MRVVPTVVVLVPQARGCLVPAVNVVELLTQRPAGRDRVWARGWRPYTGEPVLVEIPCDAAPLPMAAVRRLPAPCGMPFGLPVLAA